jgi:hypothetical protein
MAQQKYWVSTESAHRPAQGSKSEVDGLSLLIIDSEYRDEIKEGQIFYLYQPGNDAGFYRWGITKGDAYELGGGFLSAFQSPGDEGSQPLWEVEIQFEEDFEEIIPGELVKKNKVWAAHPLFSDSPPDTFRVTPGQARILNDLIRAHGFREPEGQEIVSTDMFPHLSEASKEVVNRARGIRDQAKHSVICSEDLLLALWDEGTVCPALSGAQLDAKQFDRDMLIKTIAAFSPTGSFPGTYTPIKIDRVPPLSEHADFVFQAAFGASVDDGSIVIRPRHLLHGLMNTEGSMAFSILEKLDPPVQLEKLPPLEMKLRNKALSDVWSMKDQLGYDKLVIAISDPILEGVTLPPLTVGIQAPWGQGKTTLMRMIRHYLDPPSKIRDIKAEIKKIWLELKTFKKEHLTVKEEKDNPAIDLLVANPVSMEDINTLSNIQEALAALRDIPPQSPDADTEEKETRKKRIEEVQARLINEIGALNQSLSKSPGEKKKSKSTTFSKLEKWIKEADKSESMLDVTTSYKNQPVIPSVWFNPLYYQEQDQVWAGLAHAILHQLSSRLDSRLKQEEFWLKLRAKRLNIDAVRRDFHRLILEKFLPKAAGYLVLGFSLFLSSLFIGQFYGQGELSIYGNAAWIGTIGFGIGHFLKNRFFSSKHKWSLEGKFETYIREPDYEDKLGYLRLVDEDIDRALELLTGGHPIAVFVDDLDRCSPETLTEIILAINQFISVRDRNVFFFLAMDSQKVAKILEQSETLHGKIKEPVSDSGVKSFGWHFLEKFINLPVFIPRIDDSTARDYMVSLLESSPAKEAAKPAEPQPDDAAPKPADKPQDVPGAGAPGSIDRKKEEEEKKKVQRVIKRLMDPEGEEMQKLAEVLVNDIDNNPRLMKRCLGLARLLLSVQMVLGQGERADNPYLLVVRASQLVVNWPQVITWLQEERLKPGDLEKWIEETQEYSSLWTKKLAHLDADIREVIDCPDFYEFMVKINRTPPGLGDIFKSGIF